MSNHTDSSIVEYHEDGSRTVTTVETYYPPTKGQQIAAWTTLGAVVLAPLAPLAMLVGVEKWEARKARKEAEAKKLKSV